MTISPAQLIMRSRKPFVAVFLVSVAGLVSAPGAFGTAAFNPHASCLGAGSSGLSPGQGVGSPGERAAISHELKAGPVPPGQEIAPFAQLHGTVIDCGLVEE
jgi:hypothetical protein